MASRDSVEEYRFEVGPVYTNSTSATTAVFSVGDVTEVHSTLGIHAYYKTNLTGSNNDLVWIARTPGTSSLTVAYSDPSTTSAALSIAYSAPHIVVSLATDASGGITTKANDIITYINNNEHGDAVEAHAAVQLAPSNTGVGVVTALAQQAFVGPQGTSPTLAVKLQASVDDEASWLDVGSHTTQTTVNTEEKIFTGLGDFGRWNTTITGTSAEFVYSLSVTGKEDN